MTQEMVLQILQEMFYTTTILVLPILAVTLVIGITVSLAQAITNIQEQTLVFVPKMVGVMVLLFFGLPWMFQVLIQLTHSFFGYILVIAHQ